MPLDDLPDLFSNESTHAIAAIVEEEADRLADLTIDAIRTIEPTTGVVIGLSDVCRALLATMPDPVPIAIGLVFRQSEPIPGLLIDVFEPCARTAGAEARARELGAAGLAAMQPHDRARYERRIARCRRFPENMRMRYGASRQRLDIDGIEVFRGLFGGQFGPPGDAARRLAETMVLLRFSQAVERALAADPVAADIYLYVDNAVWPHETGDMDYAPSIVRLLTGGGELIPVV